jgi:D-arabinose 1-dehydrogenase-like Zn-dependent alcohol dehydrogenase
MAKMQAVQVARAGGPLELVEREMPEPARGEVRVRVEACGVCHSDSLTVEGQWPDLSFPRIPGHEIAGVIDAIGAGVVGWRAGQRVGVGWFGGHCGHCEPCRRGWLIDCRKVRRIRMRPRSSRSETGSPAEETGLRVLTPFQERRRATVAVSYSLSDLGPLTNGLSRR